MSIIKNGNGIIGIDGDFNNSQSLSKYYQASTLVRQPSLVLEELRYPAELEISSTIISHTLNDPIAQKSSLPYSTTASSTAYICQDLPQQDLRHACIVYQCFQHTDNK